MVPRVGLMLSDLGDCSVSTRPLFRGRASHTTGTIECGVHVRRAVARDPGPPWSIGIDPTRVRAVQALGRGTDVSE